MTDLREVLNNDCDSYVFLPTEEDDNIHVQASEYKDKGTKLGGSIMGDCYHIIIFREDEEGCITDLDKFEGILSAPVEYITRMIKENWFGIVCRKTTTSEEFVNRTFDKLSEV
jgi:hypothetical protein